MIASDDIKPQIRIILGASEGEYDTDAITADLIAAYDLCGHHPADTLESIDAACFWEIVGKHAIDQDADA